MQFNTKITHTSLPYSVKLLPEMALNTHSRQIQFPNNRSDICIRRALTDFTAAHHWMYALEEARGRRSSDERHVRLIVRLYM